jgi:hypothetical protein
VPRAIRMASSWLESDDWYFFERLAMVLPVVI